MSKDMKGIGRIEETDFDIIQEIIIYVNKNIKDETFKKIIKEWKIRPDKEVLYAMMDVNNSSKPTSEKSFSSANESIEDSEIMRLLEAVGVLKNLNAMKEGMINIKGHIFPSRSIQYIVTGSKFTTRKVFTIKVNPEENVGSNKVYFMNAEIEYFNEKQRDEAFEELQRQLEAFEDINFIKID